MLESKGFDHLADCINNYDLEHNEDNISTFLIQETTDNNPNSMLNEDQAFYHENIHQSACFNFYNNYYDRETELKDYYNSIENIDINSHKANKKEEMQKKRIRSSAAKRYPQHIIVGFGRWVKRELGSDNKEISQFINSFILGKKEGQTYKISKVKEIKKLFEIDDQDDLKTKNIKNILKLNINKFWDEGYDNWIKEDFKGDEMSKTWLIKNKELLKQKITGNKSKYPQFKTVPLVKTDCTKMASKILTDTKK